MHEAALCASLLRIVEEEALRHKVRRITRVRLGLGVFSAVEPQTLSACFSLLAEGSVADGAELAVHSIPAAATCRACGHGFSLDAPRGGCPACGGDSLELAGGRECVITGLDADAGDEKSGMNG